MLPVHRDESVYRLLCHHISLGAYILSSILKGRALSVLAVGHRIRDITLLIADTCSHGLVSALHGELEVCE